MTAQEMGKLIARDGNFTEIMHSIGRFRAYREDGPYLIEVWDSEIEGDMSRYHVTAVREIDGFKMGGTHPQSEIKFAISCAHWNQFQKPI